MIILRKSFSFLGNNGANGEKPTGLSAISPAARNRANTTRWKEFNNETGGSKWRLNTGQTRKDFNSWQQQKYGNTI